MRVSKEVKIALPCNILVHFIPLFKFMQLIHLPKLAIFYRLGVDASGYEDNGVENLRCRLSSFLCQNSLKKLSQLSQIAIVNALLGLLPLSFKELIKSTDEVPAAVSPSDPTNCIREWYSGLSNEQQSLSFSLLQSASVSCCTISGS